MRRASLSDGATDYADDATSTVPQPGPCPDATDTATRGYPFRGLSRPAAAPTPAGAA